jgi:hypothetical protein
MTKLIQPFTTLSGPNYKGQSIFVKFARVCATSNRLYYQRRIKARNWCQGLISASEMIEIIS